MYSSIAGNFKFTTENSYIRKGDDESIPICRIVAINIRDLSLPAEVIEIPRNEIRKMERVDVFERALRKVFPDQEWQVYEIWFGMRHSTRSADELLALCPKS